MGLKFAELKAYKEEFNDCNVPRDWSENKILAQWIANLRTVYRSKRMPADRVQRLDEIGFQWNKNDAAWASKFAELEAYKKQYGNCNSPANGTAFGNWISNQRALTKPENLTANASYR